VQQDVDGIEVGPELHLLRAQYRAQELRREAGHRDDSIAREDKAEFWLSEIR